MVTMCSGHGNRPTISSIPDEALTKMKKVDSFLRGFIQSERIKRSRMKVNYILAGAESGRLEDAIGLLSAT